MTSRWLRWWPAAVAVVVLAGASSAAVAAANGAFASRGAAPNGQCSAPSLPGAVVDVELTDMGGMMHGGHGPGGTMGAGLGGGFGPGDGSGYGVASGAAMRILLGRATVPAGTVSLRVTNTGSIVHELVVLPLGPGAPVGVRPVGTDDRVSEIGSLGEASTTCGRGAGDGIEPGTITWVTLHLLAGNYEVVCNLPGHYAAGMYAELRAT